MPTYSYKCDNCGNELDIFTKMSLKNDQKCPSCSTVLTQVPTAPIGFVKNGVEASASWSNGSLGKMSASLTTSPN